MTAHLDPEGRFQSDRYPNIPPDLVPLSVTDKSAQDLLYIYAMRHQKTDPEFTEDLLHRLFETGYRDNAEWVHLERDSVLSQRDQARLILRTLFDIAFRPTGPGKTADNTLGRIQAHLELAKLGGHLAPT